MTSDKAPYATSHDLPKYDKRGDVTTAPWMRDQLPLSSGRGANLDTYITCNSQTAPFATFHNEPVPREYIGTMPDAPWDKDQQPSVQYRIPTFEYSKTSPILPSENIQQIKQFSGPMPDAPWDKDQRLPNACRGASSEHCNLPSSQTAPFGTSENIEHQKQSVNQVGEAPWNKDQRPPPSNRGSNHVEPILFSSSHTAPFATFDNRVTPQPNQQKAHQAPWDRDETHYNRIPARYPRDSSSYAPTLAPFATEPK